MGAGAFWNFDSSTDPSSSAFVASIYKLNDEVMVMVVVLAVVVVIVMVMVVVVGMVVVMGVCVGLLF